jgi:hypothetical protein
VPTWQNGNNWVQRYYRHNIPLASNLSDDHPCINASTRRQKLKFLSVFVSSFSVLSKSSWVSLETHIVSQLVNKHQSFLWNPEVLYLFIETGHSFCTNGGKSSLHPCILYLKDLSNNARFSMPRSSSRICFTHTHAHTHISIKFIRTLTFIPEVLSCNFDGNTDYPEIYSGFPQ